MKNIYTLTELSKEEGMSRCDFCPDIPKNRNATWKMKTRNIQNNRLIDLSFLCPECKERYDNDQFKKCSNCERLKTRGSEYRICSCFSEEYEQEQEEIEPERYSTQLEKQLHELSIEKSQAEEELQTEQEAHLAGIEATARWYKRVHEEKEKELSDKIAKLEKDKASLIKKMNQLEQENEKLKDEIKYRIEIQPK